MTLAKSMFILILSMFCFCCPAFVQEVKPAIELSSQTAPVQQKVSLTLKDVSLREMLSVLSEKTGVNFVYSDNLLPVDLRITLEFEEKTVLEILEDVVQHLQIEFMVLSGDQVVITEKTVLQSKEKSVVRISGQVVDKTTRLPLENVNVFIANSMMGAATDKDGNYMIKGVPAGAYEIVASMMGYRVQKLRLQLTEPIEKQFNFKLQPIVLQAPAIEISASERKNWQKQLKKFTKLFLGTSHNASKCQILNPEVLDFEKETRTQPFKAQASAPLEIENRALGYYIYFILEKFIAVDEEVKYLGLVKFEELKPENLEEKRQWEENRLRAYNGSFRHFFSALSARQLSEEGFLLYKVTNFFKAKEDIYREKVIKPYFVVSGKLPFEKHLYFNDHLEVIYIGEKEEEGYIDYRMRHDNTLIGARLNKLHEAKEPHEQKSWLVLNQKPVTIDILGIIQEPLSVQFYGYWAWERVAEMLPGEYSQQISSPHEKYATAGYRTVFEDFILEDKSTQWEKKLQALFNTKARLEREEQFDPGIGRQFIELATEKKATEYYDLACDLYYWGLSHGDMQKFEKELESEIARIAPLLDEKEAKQWQNDLRTKNTDLFTRIKLFWIEKDPTPSTKRNERLIEHWERIAIARHNFNQVQNTVYGTDDRGLIYVKYGEPDDELSVILGTEPSEIYNSASAYGIRAISYGDFRRGIEAFLNYPDCEVWAYRSFDSNEPVIFLFGRKEGNGSFGLRSGVEEMIPQRAFRSTSSTFGVVPGAVLQMMYYAKLSAFDLAFTDRLRELDDSMRLMKDHRQVRALRAKFKMKDKDDRARRNAPVEQSDVEQNFISIPLVSSRTRFLDDANQPELLFFAFASPPQDLVNPEDLLNATVLPLYPVRFALLVRNGTMDETMSLTTEPIAGIDNNAVFQIPHDKNQFHYTLAAEIFDSDSSVDSRNPTVPTGVGRMFYERTPPLNTDSGKLEISDLVIGVEPPSDVDFEQLPFPVIPRNEIWKSDALRIYLEIYHLKLDADEAGHFTLSCKVVWLKKKKERYEREERILTSFDFNSSESTSKEYFGISIENLKPGDYELEVEITDKVSGEKKLRHRQFRKIDQ